MSDTTGKRPLFLATGAGNGHGYTTRPLRDLPSDIPGLIDDDQLREEAERVRDATNIRDEPESIGPAIVDGYAEIAQFQHSLRHQKDVEAAQQLRPLLDAEDRIRDIRRRAKGARVDLSNETHLMQRDLERARLAGRAAPKRVLERAEKLEGLLDGIAA